MWTGISALLARAMQMDTRQLRTHLFRLAFVGFIYLMLLGAQADATFRGAPGKTFLQGIVILNAIFITLAGVSFFSSAITEEKEENTLGLLQMAGIGPMSVLLGKSTSRLIQAFMLLLVQFPFTLLSITLGGVTMQQVLAAYTSLFAYLMGLANLALFWSVVCRRTGNAAGMTALMLTLYFIAPFFAEGLHREATTRGWSAAVWYQGASLWVLEVIENSQIFIRLSEIMSTGFGAQTASSQVLTGGWMSLPRYLYDSMISTQVVTNALFGLLCFLGARVLYGPFTSDVDQLTDTRGLVLKSSSKVRLFSTGRCWGNPLVWKDFHFLTGGYPFAIVKWFAYAVLLGVIVFSNYYSDYPYPSWSRIEWQSVIGVFASLIGVILVIEASLSAARIFHDEIRLQTMSALLMLPRSVAYIGYSKTIGCLLGLLPGVSWLVICWMIALTNGWFDPFSYNSYSGRGFLEEVVFNPAVWVTFLGVSVFLHLTTLLSLFVKWGALPLAFLIMILMTWCCPIFGVMGMFVFSVMNDGGVAHIAASLTMILINVVASFVLQMMIGARLQEIGAT
jgi:hypothetical protein